MQLLFIIKLFELEFVLHTFRGMTIPVHWEVRGQQITFLH